MQPIIVGAAPAVNQIQNHSYALLTNCTFYVAQFTNCNGFWQKKPIICCVGQANIWVAFQ